jgi:hypothetical protein
MCVQLHTHLVNEFKHLNNDICKFVSRIASDFDEKQITPAIIHQMNQFATSESNKTIKHFNLSQSTLDVIFKIYSQNKSDKNLAISSINLLLLQKYYSEERLTTLFEHINQLVKEDLLNVTFFLNSILHNENHYCSILPDELNKFFENLFNKINTLLIEDDDATNFTDISFLLKKLDCLTLKKQTLSPKTNMAIRDFQKVKENLNKTVHSITELTKKKFAYDPKSVAKKLSK